MPSPFRQGVPRQSKQSPLYDCALAGVGENKDPFLCFPNSTAPAKGTVYTIFLVKNLFLFSVAAGKDWLPPCLFLFSRLLVRKSAQYLNLKNCPDLSAHLGVNVKENFKVLVAESLAGWERETGRRDQEPSLSAFQFCLFLPLIPKGFLGLSRSLSMSESNNQNPG